MVVGGTSNWRSSGGEGQLPSRDKASLLEGVSVGNNTCDAFLNFSLLPQTSSLEPLSTDRWKKIMCVANLVLLPTAQNAGGAHFVALLYDVYPSAQRWHLSELPPTHF